MALTQCRECGKEVSTGAAECPHCGVSKPALLHEREGYAEARVGMRRNDYMFGITWCLLLGSFGLGMINRGPEGENMSFDDPSLMDLIVIIGFRAGIALLIASIIYARWVLRKVSPPPTWAEWFKYKRDS